MFKLLIVCASLSLCVPQVAVSQSPIVRPSATDSTRSVVPLAVRSANPMMLDTISLSSIHPIYFTNVAVSSRARDRGMLIGAAIGVVVGFVAIQWHEYGAETVCNFPCVAVRIGAGAAVGAVVGGMVGSIVGNSSAGFQND